MAVRFYVLLHLFSAYVALIDGKVGSFSAFDRTEFEDFTWNNGLEYETACKTPYNITYMYANSYNDYIGFDNVDFSFGAAWVDVNIADISPTGHVGSIAIRLDSSSGTVIANITTGVTGVESCDFKTVGAFLNPIPKGAHDLYFRFETPNHADAIVSLDWFQFKETAY